MHFSSIYLIFALALLTAYLVMAAAPQGATVLMTPIAKPLAVIALSKAVKFAMAIVPQTVGTTTLAPWITPREARLPAISNARILLYWPAPMTMDAVQEAVIHLLITTANPFAATLSLKEKKSAMEIARQAAKTKMPAPSTT